MTKPRIVVLGLLAVLALTAISSASASAANCENEAKHFILCLGEPLVLTEGTLTISVQNDTVHSYVLKTAGIEIVCTTVEGLASVTSLSAAPNVTVQGLVLTFRNCSVVTPEHCSVSEPIKTELLHANYTTKQDFEFVPGSNNIFAVIKVNNNGGTCIAAGSFNVKGNPAGKGQLCTAPTIEITGENELFECKATGSSLLFGEEKAEFSGQLLVKLFKEGKVAKQWAIIEGK